ncbi:alpha/beta hydrolase [Planktothrix mougeotii]|uniref:Alpha/beta hydrolase n=1 Tax=Planktothrix mougeotii LEGE 06226 TaxID=1828728 RepID=A0ABR9UC87_9CYAN|nr:alpha/beta hydrolase [Planktothrix mougeotii]MBE9144042.1 alpha/beta hydrolase [Planktothrix mougeotii LEGE 06226]
MSNFAELGRLFFEGIEVYPNIAYRRINDVTVHLDIYKPRNLRGKNKTLVAIHGGGWISGNKEEIVPQLIPFLTQGWSIVNVEYRLGAVALAPAAVEDVCCALRWVFSHADEYQFDRNKIVVIGGSAGGHLATLCSILPNSAGFDQGVKISDHQKPEDLTELNIAAIINLFGIMDVNDILSGINRKDYAVLWFGQQPNIEELANKISPIHYVRFGLPPLLTIHGNRDELVPYQQAVKMHQKLDDFRVPNQLLTLTGAGHGNFSPEQAYLIYQTIQDFLQTYQLS